VSSRFYCAMTFHSRELNSQTEVFALLWVVVKCLHFSSTEYGNHLFPYGS